MIINKNEIITRGKKRIQRFQRFGIDKGSPIYEGCVWYYHWYKKLVRKTNKQNKQYAIDHNKRTYTKYKTKIKLDDLFKQATDFGYIVLPIEDLKSYGKPIAVPKILDEDIDEDMEMGLYDDD